MFEMFYCLLAYTGVVHEVDSLRPDKL